MENKIKCAAFLVCSFIISGCETLHDGRPVAVITGRAVNSAVCRPMVGRKIVVVDVRHRWPDISPSPKIGITTTSTDGKFQAIVSGNYSKNQSAIYFCDDHGDNKGPLSFNDTGTNRGWRLIDVDSTPDGTSTMITGRAIDISTAPPLAGKVLNIFDTRPRLFSNNTTPRLIGTTITGPYGKFRLDVPHRFNDNYVHAEFAHDPDKHAGWRIVDLYVYEGRFGLDDGLKFDVNSK